MSVKKVVCSIMVIALMFCATSVCCTNTSEAANNAPVTNDIYMLKGETRIAYFSFNLTAFEFKMPGDGYEITFGKDSNLRTVSCTIPANAEDHSLSPWPTDNTKTTMNLAAMSLKLGKYDNNGMFSVAATYNGEELTDHFNVKVKVWSYGYVQEISYLFNIHITAPHTYSIAFDSPQLSEDGLFEAHGTLTADGVEVDDLSKYRFYAVGLHSGVMIHNNLTITGRADITQQPWSNLTPMNLTIAVSDVSDNTTQITTASVSYTISRSALSISYGITSGNDTLISPDLPTSELVLMSGTPLTVHVDEGTEASLVYTSSSGMTQKKIYSTEEDSAEQILNTSGNGTYIVHFSRYGCEQTKTVSITLIGSLKPINSIRVTCGPASP